MRDKPLTHDFDPRYSPALAIMLLRLESALIRPPEDSPLVVEFDQRQSYGGGLNVPGMYTFA